MIRKPTAVLFCALGALLLSSGVFAAASDKAPSGEATWVEGGPYRLFARVFRGEHPGSNPILVVVLHGDGPPPYEHPQYQYVFASRVAANNPGVIAVGLLRPGYTDPQQNHSQGNSGTRNGDNWNARNTDSIAAAIGELERRYHAVKVVVAGHSGGAAITANILGRHPDLIDSALLVSCPCGDVQEWRDSMLALTGYEVFRGKIDTLSPVEQVGNLSDRVAITMIVGTNDKVAPARFSESYQAAASKPGRKVELIKLKGRPHNTFLDPAVFATVAAMVKGVQERDEDQGT